MARNKYDDLLDGPSEPTNKYDRLDSELVSENKTNLQQSMTVAADMDPDQQARILELSRRTSLPPSIVGSNYEDVAKRHGLSEMENKYDRLIEDTPRLAKYLEDPERAAVAKDDIEQLARVEKSAQSQSWAGDMVDALAYGTVNYMSGIAKVSKFTEQQRPANAKLRPSDFLMQSYTKGQNKDEMIKYLDDQAEKFKPKDISESVVTNIGQGNYGKAARSLSLQVAAAIPQLGMIAASRGYGLTMAFGSSAGSKLDENLKEGIDPTKARVNAVITGGIEAGIESVGGIGGDPLKQTLKSVIKGVGPQATKEILKESVKMVARNAGTEGVEEFATSVSQDLVDYGMGVNDQALDGIVTRAADSFLVGAGAGGGVTSVSVLPQAVAKNSQYKMSAEMTKDAYLEIGEAAEATKLKKRSPEIQAEFIESVVKDSPIQNVYVPVQDMETYFQGKGQSAVRAAQELGFLEKYNIAKESGTDVEIPMATWISKVAPTEHYKGLADDVKFNPAEYTVNQTKRESDQIREQMQNEDKVAREQADAKLAEMGAVQENVKTQLKLAGYSDKDADKQAQLYSAFFGTMADQSGRKADELYQEYGLKIQSVDGQMAIGGTTLNQDQPIAPPFYSKLQQTVEQKMGGSATVQQIQGLVKDLKPEERKWTGLDEFLKGKEKVSKAELTEFLRANALQVEEIVKGGESTKVEIGARVYNVVGPDGEVGATFLSEDAAEADAASMSRQSKEDFYVTPGEWDGETTLEDIALDGGQSQTKFSQYTLPGGENYREILFRLPPGNNKPFQFTPEQRDIKNWERTERPSFKQIPKAEVNANPEFAKAKKSLAAKIKKAYPEMKPKKITEIIDDAIEAPMSKPSESVSGLTEEIGKSFDSLQEQYKKLRRPFKNEEVFKLRGPDQNYLIINNNIEGQGFYAAGPLRKANEQKYFETFEDALTDAESQLSGEKERLRPDTYKSSHFDETNILAHTRLNDRVDADGKRVLFVEEIQSDWHQDGRKRGYKQDFTSDDKKRSDELRKEIQIARSKWESDLDKNTEPIQKELDDIEKQGPPKNPLPRWKQNDSGKWAWFSEGKQISGAFQNITDKEDARSSIKFPADVERWQRRSELIKQLDGIRGQFDSYLDVAEHLVKNNYLISDKFNEFLALDQKENQSSNAVPDAPFRKTWHEFTLKRIIRMAAEQGYDKVAWTTGEQQAERYDLSKQVDEIRYGPKDGKYEVSVYRGRTEVLDGLYSEDQLSDVVGKEVADKIVKGEGKEMSSGGKSLTGLDLKVGGEGMKGFYDKILVDFANKFGKKFGARVEESKILAGQNSDAIRIENQRQQQANVFTSILPSDVEKYTTVHSLTITPELKAEALNQGFSLFQGGKNDPRGQIQFGADRKFNISLFKSKDSTTFLHESAHFFLEVMGDLAGSDKTSQSLKDDYNAILKYLKVDSRDGIKTEQHEVFARTWEAYLMEGKAPSSALRKAFNTFKVWLTSVYRQAVNLDVELTPEIRSVMDRMLVSQDEVKRAETAMSYDPLFADPASMGMNSKQQAAYIEAREEARLYSEDQIRTKLMKDHQRSEAQFYKDKRATVSDEVRAELQGSREYKALYALQKHTMPDGSALPEGTPILKISKASLIDAIGKEQAKNVPRGTTAKEGVHVEIAAEILGYGSGTELINAISTLPDLKAAVELKTNERMAELYPDSLTDGTISEAAVQAVHSDSRAKLLRMELEYLAKYEMPVLKDAIRRVARRVPTEKMVREQAVGIIAGLKISEIRPIIYQRAEIKSAKEAGVLLAKGDIDGAFESKRKELLNHELYRSAVESKQRVEKDIKTFKKLFKSDEDLAKSRDVDMVNAARSVLAMFGITRSEKTPEDYLSQMRAYDNDQYMAVSALIESAVQNAGPYKEIKFDDFVAMSDAVMAMWDLSKSSREIEVDGVKRDRNEVMAEMSARLNEVTAPNSQVGVTKAPTDWEKAKMHLLGFRSSLRRVEQWSQAVDGQSRIFMKAMVQPIQDATTRYRLRKKDVVRQYLAIVEKTNTKDWTKSKVMAPELNYEFKDKSQLIGAVLHSGNLSNLQKLLVGRGWGTIDENGELDRSRWDQFMNRAQRDGLITKSDMDYVQAVWDLNESLKPAAQQAHKKMYGYYFNEITADEVQTQFGTYRGGYMPAVADKLMAQDAMIRAEKESLEKENNSFMFPTTGRGFTKSRVEQYSAPLSLEIGMVPAHIDKVLRFIEIEPTVKSLGRIVTDKGFRKTLDAFDPTAGGEMLMPWLQRSASQKVNLPSGTGWGWQGADKFFTAMRSRAGLQAMTLNFTNTFQQFTGITIAAIKVKPRYLRNALWTYTRSPRVTAESVMERSDYMKSKLSVSAGEMQAHIEDLITNPTKFEKAVDYAKKNGYFLQSGAQNMIDTIVWSGAYEQAIENGALESDAAKEADSAVRTTQGTLNPEDVSRFETGSPFLRLFTQFYSYFNMQANLLGTEYIKTMRALGLRKGAGRLVYVYSMGFMLPAVLSELIVQLMAGKGFDADDDDEYMDDFLRVFFGSQVRSGTALVPVVGQTTNVVVNNFNDKWYDDRISTSPAISMIESAAKAPNSVYEAIAENGSKDKAIKDTLTALGLITGLPLAPLSRPITYLGAVAEGTADPTGPVDFTRGLVTGKTGDR